MIAGCVPGTLAFLHRGETMTDSDQIRQTLARYWVYLDDRRQREWVDLFDDNPVLEFDGTVIASRADLEVVARNLDNYPGGKHLSSNELIEISGDEASVTSDVAFLEVGSGGEVGIRYYGRCVDRLRRHEGGWRFASRRISFQGGHHN
jgi:3-phenylpropionate/cinnamic acid dioxygenase small subunit